MSAPLLQITDFHLGFRTRRGTVQAVDGVDLVVNEGETVGLVGESGCGKSATVRSILRLLPDKVARYGPGEIRLNDRNVLDLPEAEMRRIQGGDVAMVFQDPMTSLNPVMTVGDQITEYLAAHTDLDRAAMRARVIELLSMVGIPVPEERMTWFPHQLSGGMRQRVMIAMALSCEPRLLLADEITTALDVTLQAQILDLLHALSERLNTATLLITHDLSVVAGMTRRVYVMYAGQIIEEAETDALFAAPAMPYTWGLLRSAPSLDAPLTEDLTPIEGLPPDLAAPPPGCRFASRCPYRREICQSRMPDLRAAPDGGTHRVRCWGAQDVPEGGWLIGTDWREDTGDPRIVADIRAASAMAGTES
ncbi:ABC transporter ATP-binding protein [Psychromarinibacter sp. C21-152]|uniref:ABC transporter ATP-binding protein n=1 Tax=Psychromarinibacter sediminicola TaxID=3033385 RepID=A0AAE3T8B4_9RHOB|nr:ABC transporter ATP-binding protein [Psychromarinibacter sediminicola]MDF0601235.1 ABC transporter ATP-binding protein [Psychromarinibacter sediminicola]